MIITEERDQGFLPASVAASLSGIEGSLLKSLERKKLIWKAYCLPNKYEEEYLLQTETYRGDYYNDLKHDAFPGNSEVMKKIGALYKKFSVVFWRTLGSTVFILSFFAILSIATIGSLSMPTGYLVALVMIGGWKLITASEFSVEGSDLMPKVSTIMTRSEVLSATGFIIGDSSYAFKNDRSSKKYIEEKDFILMKTLFWDTRLKDLKKFSSMFLIYGVLFPSFVFWVFSWMASLVI